jgi:hypothetical protein
MERAFVDLVVVQRALLIIPDATLDGATLPTAHAGGPTSL